MKRRIAFRNARLVDPASGLEVKGGLLVEILEARSFFDTVTGWR